MHFQSKKLMRLLGILSHLDYLFGNHFSYKNKLNFEQVAK